MAKKKTKKTTKSTKSTKSSKSPKSGKAKKPSKVTKKGNINPKIEKGIEFLKSYGLPDIYLNHVRETIEKEGFKDDEIDYFIKEIYTNYKRSLVVPGEPVGTVAAQSIGEPGTQMSISGSENVLIRFEESDVMNVEIGTFIDSIMAEAGIIKNRLSVGMKSDILDIPNDANLYVPAIGSDEKVHWGRVTQISRHKANIAAPLIEIKTRSGRKIIATNSHSFLIRKENQIVAIKGKNLRKTDRIPVVSRLSLESPKEFINLSNFLPKNEYWYGSELKNVFHTMDTYGREWKNHVNLNLIPVSTNRIYQLNRDRSKSLSLIQENYVFSGNLHNHEIRIPEIFPLDVEAGWLFGIYIAEGYSNRWISSIANVEPRIQEKIIKFANRYNIKHNLKKKMGPFGPSQSIEMYSTVLGSLLGSLFGKTSKEKNIPDCILSASEEFIAALIRGYFDGDGNYNPSKNQIRAGSTSKKLRDGICLLLARLGIFASKGSEKLNTFYTISVPSKYAKKWYRIIGSDIPHKLKELKKIVLNKSEKKTSYDIIDMIPGIGNVLNDLRKQSSINSKTSEAASIRKFTKKDLIGRQVLGKYINLLENKIYCPNENLESLNTLKNAYNSHVIWDEIVSIRTLLNFPFVYDFSVDYFENFLTADGIFTHNTLRTFHYAGVSEFSVTQGLPRLIEIVDARRNPSTPIMRIFLDEKHRFDKKKARFVHSQIEQIKFDTISSEIEIDLTEYTINISLIEELLEDKNITIDDIKKKLKKYDKKGIEYDEEYNMIVINPNTEDLQKLQKTKEKISKTLIQGVRGIKRGMIHKQYTDLCPEGEYSIQTEGTNLGDILTKIEGIDATRTTSNHIHEIEKFLGIEAAREIIIREAVSVLKDQSLDVNIRHLNCMADLMCVSGEIQQIGRHGISGTKTSVLARAAFEVTIKQLINASISGEEEKLQGIPENVIVGQLVPVIGTGSIDLTIDFNEAYKLLNRNAEEVEEIED